VLSELQIADFRAALLEWFDRHQRDLPWRQTTDPYAIWVSEIMLQQTRVTAVIPYYERFLNRFPTHSALAAAPEADVLAHWAGLGYYYRARNLQSAAKQMQSDGGFPTSYEAIRALPGVGEYTAAAVASIAFQLPHASVDGNVLRVLSRVCEDDTDIGSGSGRRHFGNLAEAMLDRSRPGVFNQAMMELGATICLPTNPQCLVCPVSAGCRARIAGRQNDLPVNRKPAKTVRINRTVFWIEQHDRVLLWQRPASSRLMPGFWELPERLQLPAALPGRKMGAFRHAITFHDYRFEVAEAFLPNEPFPKEPFRNELGTCQWVPLAELERLPASTILKKARRVVMKHLTKEESKRAVAVAGIARNT